MWVRGDTMHGSVVSWQAGLQATTSPAHALPMHRPPAHLPIRLMTRPPQDHLCSCYCWAVQQLAEGQVEPQGSKEETGEQGKRKEE